MFKCTRCDKEFAKRSAARHFGKVHGISAAEFKQWNLYRDSNFIIRGNAHVCRVRCDIEAECPGAIADGDCGATAVDACTAQEFDDLFEDDEPSANAPAAPPPATVQRVPDVHATAPTCNRELHTLAENVNKFVETAEGLCATIASRGCFGVGYQVQQSPSTVIGVAQTMPRTLKVEIQEDVLAWSHNEQDLQKDRIKWPIQVGRNVKDTAEFREYMATNKDEETVAIYISAVNMFTSCLTTDKGDESLLELIIESYKQGILESLWNTPLFRDSKSFGIKIAQSLQIIVERSRVTANRHGQQVLVHDLQNVIDDFLKPLGARHIKKTTELKRAKDTRETKIKILQPPHFMQKVCKDRK